MLNMPKSAAGVTRLEGVTRGGLPFPPVLPSYATVLPVCLSVSLHVRLFVCVQGPLCDTVSDFWRMVWQYHCPAIVMMTKLEERNRVSACFTDALRYD